MLTNFDSAFLAKLHGLFRELLIDYAARGDADFAKLRGALHEHEVTVFYRELAREDRKLLIDFNSEESRQLARRELHRPPAPSHSRYEWPIDRRSIIGGESLDETANILAFKWMANILPFPTEVSPPESFYIDRSRVVKDANSMSSAEAQSWLMKIDAATLHNCLFNMLRPHVTAFSIARKFRREFYYSSIEALPAWQEFERNLEAIRVRTNARIDEAIARLQARYS